MGFGDDHAIRELMRFIEMTSGEFIFKDATRNGEAPNYKCRWFQIQNIKEFKPPLSLKPSIFVIGGSSISYSILEHEFHACHLDKSH